MKTFLSLVALVAVLMLCSGTAHAQCFGFSCGGGGFSFGCGGGSCFQPSGCGFYCQPCQPCYPGYAQYQPRVTHYASYPQYQPSQYGYAQV